MKTQKKTLGLRSIAVACTVALGAVAFAGPAGADDDTARIKRGFAIAPVKLNLEGRNPKLVGLGSYIVNAQGGCNDCHTAPPYAPGGDPFKGQRTKINTKGYLAGGVKFGPFTSANITPYKNRRPHGLTYQAFLKVMRTGHDPVDNDIIQVMPWPVYANMTDHDLLAIYAYLRAIPPIKTSGGG